MTAAAVSRPAAIIFDWDNTLVDTFPTIHAAMNHVLVAMGQEPWTLAQTHDRVKASLRDRFPVLFGDRWQEARDIFYQAFQRFHLEQLAPLSGAAQALEDFHGMGLTMAVVSNKTGDYLRREATHLGWDRYFKLVVGANDVARDKPAPDPVEKALAAMQMKQGRHVWFVGDTELDMQCAVNSGCFPVLLRALPPGEGEFGSAQPGLHLPDCQALRALVKG
jgi:phosphoglycolate phosphatase